MYLFLGRPTGFKPMVEAYTVDEDMHKHIVKRFTNQGSATDEWEPNKMFKKRDFQEINPPRTMEEFYSRYDSSVGYGTAMALSLMMVLCLASTIIKFIYKRIKKLCKSKFFQNKVLRRPKIQSATDTMNSSRRSSRIDKTETRRPSCTTSVRCVEPTPTLPQITMNVPTIQMNISSKHPELPVPSLYPDKQPRTIEVHVIGPTPSASHHCLLALSTDDSKHLKKNKEMDADKNETNSVKMVLQTGMHKGRLLSVTSTSSAGSDESYVSCVDDSSNGPIPYMEDEATHLLMSPDEDDSTLTTASSSTIVTPDDHRPLVHNSRNNQKIVKSPDSKRPPPTSVKFRIPSTNRD